MPDDSSRDDAGEPGDAEVDELVDPSVELRPTQERERAESSDDVSGDATSGRGDELESDARDGVDELVEPSTELRTVQEREQEIDEDVGGGGDE